MATWLTHSFLHPFLTSCFPGVTLPDKLVSHKHLLRDLLSREVGDICVHACVLSRLSHVQLFATSWTVARQAPLSMGFSSKNTGVGCHALLQRIFPTQGSNPGLQHCRLILYHEAPGILQIRSYIQQESPTELCTLCFMFPFPSKVQWFFLQKDL